MMPRELPARPNLEQLKKQAKSRHRNGFTCLRQLYDSETIEDFRGEEWQQIHFLYAIERSAGREKLLSLLLQPGNRLGNTSNFRFSRT